MALILFSFKYNGFAQIPRTNPLNLKIDTLRAFYTSGGGNTQVKGTIRLSFKLPAGITATLYKKDNPIGTYNAVNNYGNIASITIQSFFVDVPNLNVRDDIYCFYITANNGLGNASYSRELCSIPFYKDNNNPTDGKIVLQIASFQPGTDSPTEGFQPSITSKCREAFGCTPDVDEFTTNTKTVVPYKARKILNAEVKCGEVKIFQVTINLYGMVSISDTLQNIGYTKNTPSKIPVEWAYATVDDTKVKLIWKNDDIKNDLFTLEKKFLISRKAGNGAFVQLPTPINLIRKSGDPKAFWEFNDDTSTPEKVKYAYQLKYEDNCGNISFPIDLFPIYLEQDSNYELVWSIENNNKVTGYELVNYDNTSSSATRSLPTPTNLNRFLPPDASNFYKIRGKQKGGDLAYIYSNFIENSEKIKVKNPNVFTPDNDGINDSFKVIFSASKTFSIIIYDRNGVMVYYSDNIDAHKRDGWNGKLIYTDIDAPEGDYVFQVKVTNKNNLSLTKRGVVLLIRNK